MIKVVSMDGAVFTANREHICKFQTFANSCEAAATEGEDEIFVPLLRADVLQRVLEFCEHYAEEPMKTIPKPLTSLSLVDLVQPFYAKFALAIKQNCPTIDPLLDMADAAAFLQIDPLLNLIMAYVVILSTNKTPDELIQLVGLSREDYTDAEIQDIENKTRWTDKTMADTAGKDSALLSDSDVNC